MSPELGRAMPDLFREEPFRLREIFAEEYRSVMEEAAGAQSPAGGKEARRMGAAEDGLPDDQFDVGDFVIGQLPEQARQDIARYASHLKYWIDRAWIRAAIRNSQGLEPQWPHDPLTYFKPGGGANEVDQR
ncbi:MAG TPA: hypothetical protein VHA77_17225 [Xanthobacteraceae bacterium]|nr:hypothetical protein [Xanthobacteraceae bacterium]